MKTFEPFKKFLVLVDEFKIIYYYFTFVLDMICLNDWETEVTWPRNERKIPLVLNKLLLVGHL